MRAAAWRCEAIGVPKSGIPLAEAGHERARDRRSPAAARAASRRARAGHAFGHAKRRHQRFVYPFVVLYVLLRTLFPAADRAGNLAEPHLFSGSALSQAGVRA